MSDIATGKDADFSEERLIERYNADLANSLGNLLNRTLNMIHRYRDGRIKVSKRQPSEVRQYHVLVRRKRPIRSRKRWMAVARNFQT